MTYRDSKTAYRELTALATEQGGYFTAKQAQEYGYDYPYLQYHLKAGNFERSGHGLYRLPVVPPSEYDDLIRLSFWSRDRKDVPQGVFSHETALGLHELGELLPKKIHLTVGPAFRKQAPKGCVLHKSKLNKDEIEERSGFNVTTPLRTLIDIATGTTSQEQLDKAVAEALAKGLVRKKSLLEAVKDEPKLNRLAQASTICG